MKYSELSTNSENDSEDYSSFSSRRSSFESSTSISSIEDSFLDSKKLWKTKNHNLLEKFIDKYKNYKKQCEIGEGLYKLRKILNNETDSDEEILNKWVLKMKLQIDSNTKNLYQIQERQKELSLLLDASTECIKGRIKYNCEIIHLKSINKIERKRFIECHNQAIKRMTFYLREGLKLMTLIQEKLSFIQQNINKKIKEENKRRELEDKRRKEEEKLRYNDMEIINAISFSSSNILKKYNKINF